MVTNQTVNEKQQFDKSFKKHWFIYLVSSIQLLWVKVRAIINQTWTNNYILVWDGRKEKILKVKHGLGMNGYIPLIEARDNGKFHFYIQKYTDFLETDINMCISFAFVYLDWAHKIPQCSFFRII